MKSLSKNLAIIALLILCTPLLSQATIVKKFLDEIYNSEQANNSETYIQVAEKFFNTDEFKQAILVAKRGLVLAVEEQDEPMQTRLLEIIGNSFNNLELKDSAMLYFNKALNIAETATKGGGIPEILKRISDYYQNNGEVQAAINTMKEAHRINKLSNNQDAIADNAMTLGNLYKIIGEYNKALEFYNQAKEIRLQTADEKKLIECINNIGTIYFAWGEYDKAISELNRCLIISEKLNLKEQTANSLNNIGVVYYVLGEENKSEDYFQRAKRIHELLGDENLLTFDYNNLGSFYLGKKQYDSAQNYFNKALEIHDKLGQKFEKIEILSNIALIYKDENRFTESLKYLNKALKLANESGNKKRLAKLEMIKGRIYLYFKNQEKAIEHFNQCIEIASKHNLRLEMMESLKSLSEIYEKKNNAIMALEYYKKFYELKDTIFSENTTNRIAELETKYETERKEKEIELLVKEKNHQQKQIEQQTENRKIMMVLFIVAFVLLISIFFIFYQRYRVKHKNLMAKAMAEQQKIRFISVLQTEEKERKRIAQDLHDSLGQILSTAKLNLSGIESALKETPKQTKDIYSKAAQLIDQACSEVRNISHNIMPSTLIKVGLLAAIKDLAEKINSSPEINVDVNIDGFPDRLDEKTEFALYRIVQEIMSNIIKHSKANQVYIDLIKDQTKLICHIKDNGIGFNKDQIKNSKGIGWKNIYSRLDVINGNMEIDCKKGSGCSTSIKISFPIEMYELN